MVALFQHKFARGRRFLIGCYPTASIFFTNVYTQEKEAGATFAWDVHDRLRGEKLLAVYLQIAWNIMPKSDHFPKFTPVMVVSSSGEGTSLLVFLTPREHARRPRYGPFPFIKKCHFPCHWLLSPSNRQWDKIYSCIRNLAWTNNGRNMSLQTTGISWKHALVFFY